MTIVSRGRTLIQNEGVVSFLRRSIRFAAQQMRRHASNHYWLYQGGRKFELSESVASFRVESSGESDILRHFADGEQRFVERVFQDMGRGSVVLDVGANIGVYTCLLGVTDKPSKIAAIEPHPGNFEALQENIERNGIDATAIQAAASDTSGSLKLASGKDGPGAGTANVAADSGMEVDSRRIDELVDGGEIPCPDVVKIDVEGAEMDVLKGMSRILDEAEIRSLYVEVHPEAWHRDSSISDFGYNPSDVPDFLKEKGYSVEVFDDRGHEHHVQAKRPSRQD